MTTAKIAEQLPPGAQRSIGNTKDAVGVLTEGAGQDADILLQQAEAFARNAGPGAAVFTGGNSFTDETLKAVMEGSDAFKRDGTFAGNNATFTGYYLQPAAKFIIPQTTPLRNMTPRDTMPGIDTINWRAVTDYFGGAGPSVAGGAVQQFGTPSALSYQFVSASNVAKLMAYRDLVSFESELYGKMFEGDVRALVAAKLIPALMQVEEIWLINSGQRLWAPSPIFNVSTATTGGTLAAGVYWFLITAANANGETLAYQTTASTITTTGSTSTITFNIPTVPSATKYNVYCGINATQPANSAMWLQSATTQFGGATALNQPTTIIKQGYITVTMTAAPATSGTAYSTVVSAGNTSIVVKSTETNTNNLPLTFDGAQALLYLNAGVGSTLGVGGETPLIAQPAATNGALALTDIDTLLENMYLNAHADPDYMFVSIKDHKKLSYLVAQGTNFRVTVGNQDTGLGNLVAGQRVTKYINQTTGRLMDVIMLPYLGQGTIMMGSFSIPFPVSEIDKPPFRVAVNRDMWAVEYPPDQSHFTQWAYAAYLNETLVNQYLGGWGLLTGISL